MIVNDTVFQILYYKLCIHITKNIGTHEIHL
jgi:hypothetical protein